MKILYFILLPIMSVLCLHCATILTGTSDHITINTMPEGARVYIDGIQEGVTPLTVKVKRSFDQTDGKIQLDGYGNYIFKLKKQFNWVSLLNLTNPFGWAVDIVTGSLLKYYPKSYYFEMEKNKN